MSDSGQVTGVPRASDSGNVVGNRVTNDSGNVTGNGVTSDSGNSRECPVCGESFPVSTGPGRPQVYCSTKCRWRAGHEADARARHKLMAERNRESFEDLLAWVERQHFN